MRTFCKVGQYHGRGWALNKTIVYEPEGSPPAGKHEFLVVDKSDYCALLRENSHLKGELGKVNAHTQVLMQSTEEIMQGKDQELQHLRINVKHNIDRVMQLEGEKRELEGEKSECINQIVIFADKLNTAHLNLKATEQSHVATEAKLNATKQSLLTTEAKLNATGTKLTATEEKLKSTEAALESAQHFLVYQLNQNEILQYAANGNKKKLDEAEAQIEELQLSVDAFKEQLASNKVQLKDTEKALEDAKRQILDLKEGNQEMSKRNKEFKKYVEKLEKANSGLENFNKEYAKQLSASEAKVKEYTDAETEFNKAMADLSLRRGPSGPTDPMRMALCVMTLLNQARSMLNQFGDKTNLGVRITLRSIEEALGPAQEVRSEPTVRRGKKVVYDYVDGK